MAIKKRSKPRNLNYIHVQVRITHDDYKRIRALVDEHQLSMNGLINALLENWVDEMTASNWVNEVRKHANGRM